MYKIKQSTEKKGFILFLRLHRHISSNAKNSIASLQ